MGETENTVKLFISVSLALVVLIFLAFGFLFGASTVKDLPESSQTFHESQFILVMNGTQVTLNNPFSSLDVASTANISFLNFSTTSTDVVAITSNYTETENYSFSIFLNTRYCGATQAAIIDHIYVTLKPWTIESAGRCDLLFKVLTNTSLQNITAGNVSTGKWTHVAATYEGTTRNLSLYVGGRPVNTTILNGIPNSTSSQFNVSASAFTFVGGLDEFRFYNRTITANEVAAINFSGRKQNVSLSTNSLMIWFPFNEQVGSTAYDLSPQRNNGTIITAVYLTDGINVSLIQNTDFTAAGTTFTLINPLYEWNNINFTYGFIDSKNEFSSISGNFSLGTGNLFSVVPTIYRVLGIVLILGVIMGIIFFVLRLRNNEETGL